MAGPEFHQTGYGRTFFEYQLPMLIKALNRLAEAMEKQNRKEEMQSMRAAQQMTREQRLANDIPD